MNKSTGIIIGVITLVIIAGGIYVSMSSKDSAMTEKEKMEQQVMADAKIAEEKVIMEQKAMAEKDAVMKNEETGVVEKTDTMIEKSVNTVFDLLARSPLDSLIDLGKFLYQNRS